MLSSILMLEGAKPAVILRRLIKEMDMCHRVALEIPENAL